MKKFCFLFIFIVISSPFFAQEYREPDIFVPQIAGSGDEAENAFFHDQLSFFIDLNSFPLARNQRSSDYIFKATVEVETQEIETVHWDIQPVEPALSGSAQRQNRSGIQEFFSRETDSAVIFFNPFEEPSYVPEPDFIVDEVVVRETVVTEKLLYLELINSQTDEVVARQNIIYYTTDETLSELLSIVVNEMLSYLPKIEIVYDWRDNWMFLNFGVMWNPGFNIDSFNFDQSVNFGMAFSVEYHLLDYMSVGLGIQFSQDYLAIEANQFHDWLLEVPLSFKYILKISDLFLLEPYAGAALNIPVSRRADPFSMSGIAGLQFGVKTGFGILTIDPRFSVNITSFSRVLPSMYTRYRFQIVLGYKAGFFHK